MPIRGPLQVLVALIFFDLALLAGQPLAYAVASAVLGTLLVYLGLTVLLFGASRFRHTVPPPELRLGFVEAAVLFLREWHVIILLYGYYHIPALTRKPAGRWRTGNTDTAIIFTHGFCCNSGFWLPLMARIGGRLPHSVYTITLSPLWFCIDRSAEQLAALVDQARADGHERIILIGHSMGGLISRCCYQHYPDQECIVQIITLGSPHHGTWEAYLSPWRNAKQMRPGSPWLDALNGHDVQHPRITSIYSLHDSVITPQDSSRLDGATNVELAGIGHMEMSRHPRMLEEILRALDC